MFCQGSTPSMKVTLRGLLRFIVFGSKNKAGCLRINLFSTLRWNFLSRCVLSQCCLRVSRNMLLREYLSQFLCEVKFLSLVIQDWHWLRPRLMRDIYLISALLDFLTEDFRNRKLLGEYMVAAIDTKGFHWLHAT